jgi:hypothetical protein
VLYLFLSVPYGAPIILVLRFLLRLLTKQSEQKKIQQIFFICAVPALLKGTVAPHWSGLKLGLLTQATSSPPQSRETVPLTVQGATLCQKYQLRIKYYNSTYTVGAIPLQKFFQNSPINWTELTRNRHKENKMKAYYCIHMQFTNLKKKLYPALRS